MRRNTEEAGILLAYLQDQGITANHDRGGRRPKLRFNHAGRQHTFPISRSGTGDVRAVRNKLAELRRLVEPR